MLVINHEQLKVGFVNGVNKKYPKGSTPINESKYVTAKPPTSSALPANSNAQDYLNIDTMVKMVQKFLTEKLLTKAELSTKLKISIVELDRLLNKQLSPKLIVAINLPLIKLYCKTRWSQPNSG